jgi:hypothetical protein
MAKRNNFKRIRKIADITEHNRKYALLQAEQNSPEALEHKVSELHGAMRILPAESPPKQPAPSLGELFSFCK